ncbi:MAG: hypothetical protein QM529_05685 [Hydrotalea sp.]|nr:hypothetical protein [Hydrotalea sp.]
MSLRQKISNIASPFNSNRLLLILLTLLVAVLIGLVVHFFFFGKHKQTSNFDSQTLCLYSGSSNGVMVFIDQTSGITAKQAAGINRRVKKIAIDQVDQFGRLTFYTLTRDNQTQKIGFVCNPGNLANIQDSWVKSLGMTKKQIFDYYKSEVTDLSNQALDQMINKPQTADAKIMEGLRDAITLYKTPTTPPEADATATDAATNILPDETSLDWLVIFSDMKEQRPDFSLRTATAKTTPTILDFWANNSTLKLDLSDTAVGIYYFKDKKDKKKNKKSADDASNDNQSDGNYKDDTNKKDASGKKQKKKSTTKTSNSKFHKFWEDYWQSQGATVEWFRGME